MQLSTQKTPNQFHNNYDCLPHFLWKQNVWDCAVSTSVPLPLLPYSLANFKQMGCMRQRKQIPTNFGGQREKLSLRLWLKECSRILDLSDITDKCCKAHTGKASADFILSLCVDTFMSPLNFFFDIDSLSYNKFMPWVLCTSTEKPVDYEAELIADQGLGGLVLAGFCLMQCHGIKQYSLTVVVTFWVEFQPAVKVQLL